MLLMARLSILMRSLQKVFLRGSIQIVMVTINGDYKGAESYFYWTEVSQEIVWNTIHDYWSKWSAYTSTTKWPLKKALFFLLSSWQYPNMHYCSVLKFAWAPKYYVEGLTRVDPRVRAPHLQEWRLLENVKSFVINTQYAYINSPDQNK